MWVTGWGGWVCVRIRGCCGGFFKVRERTEQIETVLRGTGVGDSFMFTNYT